MIFYVTHQKHAYTHFVVLHHYRQDLRRLFRSLPYDRADLLLAVGEGVVIWTDMDRMSQGELVSAARLSDRLSVERPALRQLNHPTRSLQRYDLLRALHRTGVNTFRAFRAGSVGQELAFPVFVRDEAGATYRQPGLIGNADELRNALADPATRRMSRPLVVEFVGSPAVDGYFRKYSAYRVGETIYAQHCFASPAWFIKRPAKRMRADHVAELREYVSRNPHREALLPIFESAGIQYGRIDYTLVGDRIQVFEINTNPTVLTDPPTRFDTYDSRPYADAHADAALALPGAAAGLSTAEIDAIDRRLFASFRRRYWRKGIRLALRGAVRRLLRRDSQATVPARHG